MSKVMLHNSRSVLKNWRAAKTKSPWLIIGLVSWRPPDSLWGAPGAQKEIMLKPIRVSQTGALARRKQPPEPRQNTSEIWH